ncbi:MAG: hypothetical protein U0527_00530 [Candidatus Eisenbacteria bacterium]
MIWPAIPPLASAFLLGAAGSIPVAGPISVLVLRRGLSARFAEARATAIGAAVAEAAHVFLARRGLGWLATRWPALLFASRTLGCLLLAATAAWLWLRPVQLPSESATEGSTARARVGVAAHLGLGFALAIGNLGILINWAALLNSLHLVGQATGVAQDLAFAAAVVGRHRRGSSRRSPSLRGAARVEGMLRWTTRAVAVLLLALAVFAAVQFCGASSTRLPPGGRAAVAPRRIPRDRPRPEPTVAVVSGKCGTLGIARS